MAYAGPAFLTGSTGGRPHISNIEMLGGLVSGSTGEYISLPVSSSDIAGVAVQDAVSATSAVFTKAVLSASFVGSSGSIVQALNYLKGNIDAQLGSADLDFSGESGTGAVELDSQTFSLVMTGGTTTAANQAITFAVANASNGGIEVASDSIAVDLNNLAAGTIAAADSIAIIDANDSNASKKESIADVATLFAGTVTSTGLAASSAVLSVDIQNLGETTAVDDADLVMIDDGAGGTLKKMTRANLLGSAKALFVEAVEVTGTLAVVDITGSSNITMRGFAAFDGNITSNNGAITSVGAITSTGGAVQAGTTVSAGGEITAGTNLQAGAAGQHSYVSGTELRMVGTDASGDNRFWALQMSGGMLQINDLGATV